jgi:hypothetical protein
MCQKNLLMDVPSHLNRSLDLMIISPLHPMVEHEPSVIIWVYDVDGMHLNSEAGWDPGLIKE